MDYSYQKIPINNSVLVLNSDYSPINICDGRRAIVLLLKQKAHMITEKVIRLLDYIRIPFAKIMSHKPSRNLIHKRDNYTCQYCGAKEHLTIDHIIPSSRGGGNDWCNLVSCCISCNTKKGNHTPREVGMYLLREPKPPFNKVHLTINASNVSEWKEFVYS